MKQQVLLCPGPVVVSSRVRRATIEPDICHREKEFSVLLSKVRSKLLRVFKIARTHKAVVVSGSGTAALETAVLSSVRPRKKLLVIDNGVYGQRILKIAKIHGIKTVHLRSPILEALKVSRIERALKKNPQIDVVAMVHHETSTGLLNPADQVGRLARKNGKIFLLDAISSLGADGLSFKHVDICVGSAGKCLHGYPGLSFVLVGNRARSRLSQMRPKSLYLDLRSLLQSQEKGESPFTPAVQLIRAFDVALDQLLKVGLSSRIRAYQRNARFITSGLERLGIRCLLPESLRSSALSALRLPRRMKYATLHAALKKKGFVIYAGQSKLSGKIFRISAMGSVTPQQLKKLLRVMSVISKKQGWV